MVLSNSSPNEGCRVFIPDEEGIWLPGTIVKAGKGENVVEVVVQKEDNRARENPSDQDKKEDGSEATIIEERREIDLSSPFILKALQECYGLNGVKEDNPQCTSGNGVAKSNPSPEGDGEPEQCVLSLPLQNTGTEGTPNVTGAGQSVGVEDMCKLNHLHEPSILYNLKERFENGLPYTYTGDICIAVNPYKWHSHLYTETLQKLHLNQRRWELPPHIYATSAQAYAHLSGRGLNQSILVSGESGAGKTETVKLLMAHFAFAGGAAGTLPPSSASTAEGTAEQSSEGSLAPVPAPSDPQERRRSSSRSSMGAPQSKRKPSLRELQEERRRTQEAEVVRKVLHSSPLLEAFGNARTVRNDNSSRFGKYTQLQFSASHRLVGARCRHYLLEKSRVVQLSAGERSYHIFYQLLAAAEETKARFGLAGKTVCDFEYLRSGDLDVSDREAKNFARTQELLHIIGVDAEEQEAVFSLLAGILHLGQISFAPTNDGDASQIDSSDELTTAARLLGCLEESMAKTLVARTVKARQEIYSVPLRPEEAAANRDALSKDLYARLFDWLVGKVNKSTSIAGEAEGGHVDILDIFGFESFEHNSFEQFCINYANEKLQHKFTCDVFQTVQKEYVDEGIPWSRVDFEDNQRVLALIEGRLGLVSLLNEECVRPQGSDKSFVSKSFSVHSTAASGLAKPGRGMRAGSLHLLHTGSSSNLSATLPAVAAAGKRTLQRRNSDVNNACFVIKHYAGEVLYDSAGFVEKNKDALNGDIQTLMGSSENKTIANLFSTGSSTCTTPRRGSSMMAETVSSKFKTQLHELMTDIASTEVQYIRCLKPNLDKSATEFDKAPVVHQLRCAGVVEAVRISRSSFPNRQLHLSFLERFSILMSKEERGVLSADQPMTAAEACAKVASVLIRNKEKYEIGKTKIFFRRGVLEAMEDQRGDFIRRCAIIVGKLFRGLLQQRRYRRMRKSISTLQAHHRRKHCRRRYTSLRSSAVTCQKYRRGLLARRERRRRKQIRSAVRLQSAWRGSRDRRAFVKVRAGLVLLQATVKARLQRQAYQKELAEWKEQQKMENQIELLKKKLESEQAARRTLEDMNLTLRERMTISGLDLMVIEEDPDGESERGSAAQISYGAAAGAGALGSTATDRSSSMAADAALLGESERMLEYATAEISKLRELNEKLRTENSALKSENKRVKDAYTAAGASFAALNQHSKHQSQANLRLMSTHAALIKSHQEKTRKMNKELEDLRQELALQKTLYQAEVGARERREKLMKRMLQLVEDFGADENLIAQLQHYLSEVQEEDRAQAERTSSMSLLSPSHGGRGRRSRKSFHESFNERRSSFSNRGSLLSPRRNSVNHRKEEEAEGPVKMWLPKQPSKVHFPASPVPGVNTAESSQRSIQRARGAPNGSLSNDNRPRTHESAHSMSGGGGTNGPRPSKLSVVFKKVFVASPFSSPSSSPASSPVHREDGSASETESPSDTGSASKGNRGASAFISKGGRRNRHSVHRSDNNQETSASDAPAEDSDSIWGGAVGLT